MIVEWNFFIYRLSAILPRLLLNFSFNQILPQQVVYKETPQSPLSKYPYILHHINNIVYIIVYFHDVSSILTIIRSKVTSSDQSSSKTNSISPVKNVKAKCVIQPGCIAYVSLINVVYTSRIDTRRTKTAPVVFDFSVRTGAKLNKIAEEYWKKQMEEEAQQTENHSVTSTKSNST